MGLVVMMTNEEAIKTLHELWRETNDSWYEEAFRIAVEALKTDRPHGEWIKATGMMPPEFHGHHCCSECGNFANMESPFGNREDLSNFCPTCGALMGGDTE